MCAHAFNAVMLACACWVYMEALYPWLDRRYGPIPMSGLPVFRLIGRCWDNFCNFTGLPG